VEWRPARGVSRICWTALIHAPDMICLTETHYDLLSQHGYSICSRPDSPYPIREGRRKGFSPASHGCPRGIGCGRGRSDVVAAAVIAAFRFDKPARQVLDLRPTPSGLGAGGRTVEQIPIRGTAVVGEAS